MYMYVYNIIYRLMYTYIHVCRSVYVFIMFWWMNRI